MLLFGGSGHAKVIRDCIKSDGGKVTYIFDDNPTLQNLDETPVIGSYNPQFHSEEPLIISIGDNFIRRRISFLVKHKFGKAFHSSSVISESALIEEGTVVLPNCVINASSQIGKHVILNTSSVIEHDCRVGNFVHISPGATLCGNVSVGEGTHIGAGAVIIPNLNIGKWCIIGAGAVIVDHIPDFSLVVGVPGKIIRDITVQCSAKLI